MTAQPNRKRRLLAAAVLAGITSFSIGARADIYQWQGTSGQDWYTPNLWYDQTTSQYQVPTGVLPDVLFNYPLSQGINFQGDYSSSHLNSLDVSNHGEFIFSQTGGVMASVVVYIASGVNGNVGVYSQSGGTNFTQVLNVGTKAGTTGEYDLGGLSNLEVMVAEFVGCGGGFGSVSQTGAFSTNSCPDLEIGGGNIGPGASVYSLTAGELFAGSIEIYGSLPNGATASFNQNGGSVSLSGSLRVGVPALGYENLNAYYRLSAGTLTAASETVGGTGDGIAIFYQTGGLNVCQTLTASTGATPGDIGAYSLYGGTLLVSGNETIGLGSGNTGAFIQYGGTHTISGSLMLGNDTLSSGSYNINLVSSAPTLSVTGSIILANASESRGTFTLGPYAAISADEEDVGAVGSGTFIQGGGANQVNSFLEIGVSAGSSGTYTLNDGTLRVGGGQFTGVFVGDAAAGTFNQNGGTFSFASGPNTYELNIGYASSGSGVYNLMAGNLSAPIEYVGRSGMGRLTQAGGTNTITTQLVLGFNSAASGTYSLSSGFLEVTGSESVGYAGFGRFNQSGGTHTITGNALTIGDQSGSNGIYILSSGTLNANDGENIGNAGTGTFTQVGGSHVVAAALNLGVASGASGAYFLQADSASLHVSGSVYVGGNSTSAGGTGALNISAGTMDVDDTLKIYPGSTVSLSGGLLRVGSLDTSSNPSLLQWTAGGLYILGSGGLFIGPSGPLGSTVAVTPAQTLFVGHTLIVTGTLAVTGSGKTDVRLTANDFVNEGNVTITTAAALVPDHLTNQAGATLTINGGLMLIAHGVTNYGTIIINGSDWSAGPADTYGIVELEPSNAFFQDLTLESTGSVVGGVSDNVYVAGNLTDISNDPAALNGTNVHMNGAGPQKIILGTAQAKSITLATLQLGSSPVSIVDAGGAPITLQVHDLVIEGSTMPSITGNIHIIGAANLSGRQTVSSGVVNPGGTPVFWTDTGNPALDGDFVFSNGATYTNTGTFNAENDRNFTGSGVFHNTGTFRKQASGGTTAFGIPFNNDGAVEVHSGTLQFNAAGIHNGTFSVFNGATLDFHGGAHNFPSAASFSGNGSVNFSGATLSATKMLVGDGINGGLGDNLTLNHSASIVTVSGDFFLSVASGDDTYNLSSGTLNVGSTTHIGYVSSGTFNQTGGTHNAGYMIVGDQAGASGFYTLGTGAVLTVTHDESIGSFGDGTFTQNGGTHTANTLGIGGGGTSGTNGSGTFNMGGGTLAVAVIENIGVAAPGAGGLGILNQTGGTHAIHSEQLIIGRNGTYNLSGTGQLLNDGSIGGLVIGGSFHQFSSTSTVDFIGGIVIDGDASETATYQLDAGNLTSRNNEYIGEQGSGTFIQNGGTHSVMGNIYIAAAAGATGTYQFNAGTLSVNGNILNNGTLTQSPTATLNLTGTITGSGSMDDTGPTTIADGTQFNGNTINAHGAAAVLTSQGSIALAAAAHSTSSLALFDGASAVIHGNFGVGNDGTLTGGATGASATVTVANASLQAHTIYLGNTKGSDGALNISSLGNVKAAGFSVNDVTMTDGSSLQIIPQAPQPGDDPEVIGAMVGGYLRNGAMNMNGGTLTSPAIKLGITAGCTGTYTQTAGSATVTLLAIGNDASLASGAGVGHVTITGGSLHADTVLIGSAAGGSGDLTISGAGTLDLTGGQLGLRSSSASLSADDLTYRNYIAAGQLTSAGSAYTGLGLLRGSDYLLLHGLAATFGGQAVSSTDILIKYTYLGDATFDGQITVADYAQIDSAFLLHTANPQWVNGDFNYDGTVNYQDYALIDFAYQQQSGALAAGEITAHAAEFGSSYTAALAGLTSAVPEPRSLLLLTLGSAALLRGNRRRQNRRE